jgi:3-hydroxybutyryl-CoA dehydrogenase
MFKVYLTGSDSINNELKKLFGSNISVVDNTDAAEIIIESTNYPVEKKLDAIKNIDVRTDKTIPILTSSLCVSVSEQCTVCKYPDRLIGTGLYDTISSSKQIEIAPSKIISPEAKEKVEKFLKSSKINYSVVPDRVGLVFPRILAMIINEAAQVYDEMIASREDIDTAMKLGTNYPFGPLEWADKIGVELIYNILTALNRDFGDDRYRAHPSLKEMVNMHKRFYEQ